MACFLLHGCIFVGCSRCMWRKSRRPLRTVSPQGMGFQFREDALAHFRGHRTNPKRLRSESPQVVHARGEAMSLRDDLPA